MASKVLGRVACPIKCGHDAAHVKLKTDKEGGKAAYPYVHCRGCGIQLHARNQEQAEHLLKITRPEKIDEPSAPEDWQAPPAVASAAPAPIVAEVPPKTAAPRGGLFDGLFGRVPA